MALDALTGFLTGYLPNDSSVLVFLGLIVMMMILFVIAIYTYISFAFMRIAERAGVESPGLAWIPCFGPTIIAYKNSKMDPQPWWSLLISVLSMIIGLVLLTIGAFSSSTIVQIIGILVIIVAVYCLIYFSVYAYIWTWKLFEKVGRPGWWAIIPVFGIPFALLGLIPLIGIMFSSLNYFISLWYLVIVGIVAWGETEKTVPTKVTSNPSTVSVKIQESSPIKPIVPAKKTVKKNNPRTRKK